MSTSTSNTDALDAEAAHTDAREGARVKRTAESVPHSLADVLAPFGPDSFGGDEYRVDGDVTSTERAAQAAREAAESTASDGHTTCTSGPAPRLCTRCGQAPEEPAVTLDAKGNRIEVMACRRCDASVIEFGAVVLVLQ